MKFLKFFESSIKSVDETNFTVTAVVSTKKVDRDGDIVTPEAFRSRLKTYKDHPVFLSSHRYGSLLSQIGEAVDVKITDQGLEAKFKYYVNAGNPEADWAFLLAKQGIAAFSIGFMGFEYDWIREKQGDSDIVTGRKFTDVELLEISQVTVPSNRGALQMGRSALAVESGLLEMAEKSFADGKLTDLKTACECVFKDKHQAILKGDICADCKLPITKEQKAKAEELAKTNEAAKFCACADMPRSIVKEGSECGVCSKPLTEEAKVAVKDFVEKVSGKHYSEVILEKGSDRPLPSPLEMSEAVKGAFKQINEGK